MADNIKHIVYLLLENQSFDRMLGDGTAALWSLWTYA
jgi:phospholipase C